jgi:RNA polymerase sigma factor (sigma-70 family)
MIRAGHHGAFEVLFNRYQSRLLTFCRHMLRSHQDAEDVLQEVFAAAYKAMLSDEREINVRPWLYRIARNRCLNHLRRPTADGQDEMDIHPMDHGATTHDQVQSRQEFRELISDVGELPETQRTALLLREIDGMSYEDIARTMETTVPSIKSLLVRARINLAESSKARLLTCDDVRVELAEAAEGLGRASGPARRHIRSCEPCKEFRSQLRSDNRALASLFPLGPLAALHHFFAAKLGGAASATSASTAGAGAGAAGGGATASGIGAAVGAKAVASVASVALLTAGAVEVKRVTADDSAKPEAAKTAEEKPGKKSEQEANPTVTTAAPTTDSSSTSVQRTDAEPTGDSGGTAAGSSSGGTSGGSSETTTTTTPTEPAP